MTTPYYEKSFLAIFLILLSGNYIAQRTVGLSEQSDTKVTTNRLRGNSSTLLRGGSMCFTQNKGQVVDMNGHLQSTVLFAGSAVEADIYLRKNGFSYVLNNENEAMREINEQVEDKKLVGEITEQDIGELRESLLKKQTVKLHRIDIDFVNANANAQIETTEQVEGYTNYYLGHCPEGVTNVFAYNKVTIKNIYNKIDVVYYGNKGQGLKYDIVINPGADLRQLQLKYSGADGVEVKNGELKIRNSLREISEQLPKVYQSINGKIVDVKCKYKLEEVPSIKTKVLSKEAAHLVPNTSYVVHFELGTYNSELPLIIDPWVTYYGGTSVEETGSIAVDKTGNVIFTGRTNSANFPSSPGAHQTTLGGCLNDAFVVKMNSNGARLWATFYGGTGCETATGVATDNGNNILVSGYTFSSNAIAGATAGNVVHQAAYSAVAGNDAFLVKFDPNGARLWGTYYGGTNDDKAFDVACDGSNIYLYGTTQSTNAISTAGAFQPALYTNPICGTGANISDVFVAKFAANGTRVWGTYVGGACAEICGGITCDLVGDIYIGGTPRGTNFPVSPGAFLTVAPIARGFLFKFNPAGGRLWATYYSGNIQCVATDGLGNVVAGGLTSTPAGGSPPPIATPGAFQSTLTPTPSWPFDIFVVKFNSAGSRLWGTYLGGGASASVGDENCTGIACDVNNNVIVSGDTYTTDFPTTSCAYQATFKGSEDQFITTFDPNGTLICSSYMGLAGTNNANNESVFSDVLGGSIATDGCFVYMVAMTDCGYPVTAGAYKTTCNSNYDIALAKLYINTCNITKSNINFNASQTNFCAGQTVDYTSVNPVCNPSSSSYSWSFPGGTPTTSSAQHPTGIAYNTPGTYDVMLYTSCDSIKMPNYITVKSCDPCVLTAQFTKGTATCTNCGCQEWILVNGVGGTTPYTYTWQDGYDKRYKNKVCPGNYVVNIKDKNGCSVDVNVTTP